MYVKTTFLHGIIQEEIYVEQPLGFEAYSRESHVCCLKKVLYGLKKAPRAWYSRIDAYLQHMGFIKCDVDPNLYYIVVDGEMIMLILYVDDLFITGAKKLIEGCVIPHFQR